MEVLKMFYIVILKFNLKKLNLFSENFTLKYITILIKI